MAAAGLPEDGELRLGPVSLPAGTRVRTGYGTGEPVAWATLDPVPDTGRVWAALSRAHRQTGLVPFLLAGLDGDTKRPWDEHEFDDPADTAGLGGLDAAVLLEEFWYDRTHEVGVPEEEQDEDFREYVETTLGPFGLRFPGLAPAEDRWLDAERLDEVLGSLPAARIGLVPAARPADVLPLIGWSGATNVFDNALPIAAVLRSWEERFGAKLLEVGFARIRLLAGRPPRTFASAQAIAAEHVVLCHECAGQGLTEISAVAASLMETPVWTFWWD